MAKRSFDIATRFADRRGDVDIGPEHLLYGVVHDAVAIRRGTDEACLCLRRTNGERGVGPRTVALRQ